ncbi:MAG: DUF86 domain-containing protein [Candidatus Altiarchaeota archaeon]
MKRKHSLLIKDILEAIAQIQTFTGGMSLTQFQDDDKTSSAVVRKLEIIGEAAKNVPSDIRQKNKAIPWSDMAKTRDKIIHGYFGVDYDVIWKTIQEKLPEIKTPLKQLLKELEKQE